MTERTDQSPQGSYCRQTNQFCIDTVAPDDLTQLDGCLGRQPLAGRVGEIKVRFDGCAEDSLSSKQIRNLRIHV